MEISYICRRWFGTVLCRPFGTLVYNGFIPVVKTTGYIYIVPSGLRVILVSIPEATGYFYGVPSGLRDNVFTLLSRTELN
jgi:hypothetical protein